MPIPGLETYEPDGAMPWPLVLVEGEEHAGKTWDVVAFLKQCDLIGEGYWIPLDEGGHARMYGGRLPGKMFEIVKLKTGETPELVDKIKKIKAHAAAQHTAGEKPVVLVIDSISGVWSGLHDWVNARHRETKRAKAMLRDDPNADVGKAGRNLWNDAEAQWRSIVKELKTFPGLVILTARGKEVSATDPDTGQPALDAQRKPIKEWSVEVRRGFTYYVDVWLRKRREEGYQVVSVRSVEFGKKPGSKEAKQVQPIEAPEAEGRELAWLLFDCLGLDPKTAYVNEFIESSGGGVVEAPADDGEGGSTDWLALTARATNPDAVYRLHGAAGRVGQLTPEIDQAMRARVAEMQGKTVEQQTSQVGAVAAAALAGKPAAVPAAEEVPPPAEPPAEEPAPETDPAEAEQAEAERRGMLRDELKMIAELMGLAPGRLIANKQGLGKGVDVATMADLQKGTHELRAAAILKLRNLGRNAEADHYAQVGAEEFGPRSFLLGEAAEQADKAA